jgi:NADH dehydrogenase FAD-containing subunit
MDRAGRIKEGSDLSVPGHPEISAIGDIAGMRVDHENRSFLWKVARGS